MSKIQAIIMKPKDNVCTVVEAVAAGTEITASCGEIKSTTQVLNNIPAGHKFAIKAIGKGEPVIKYGEIIGLATRDIEPGQHVHVHNIESCRGRGDK